MILILVLLFFIPLILSSLYFIDFYDPKYPVKLTLIWYLMFLGIRTDGMSAEAHRIYNDLDNTISNMTD